MTRDEIDALINKAATKNAAPVSSLNSLMPSTLATQSTTAAPALALVPDAVRPVRPVYEEYKPAEWDPTSQFEDTRGWKWTKNARAHDRFNEEQNALAAQHLTGYNAEVAAYTDELNAYNAAIERQREDAKEAQRQTEKYFTDQGLLAPQANDLTPTIRNAQAQWQIAKDAGNQQAMDYWHNTAEAARAKAGLGSGGDDGSLTAAYMTLAGTPTYGRLYDERKWEADRADTEWDKNYKLAALYKSGSGGGGGGGGGGRASTGTQSDRDAAGKADVYASLIPYLSDSSIPIEQIEAQIYADAPGYAERKLKVEDMIDHAYTTRYGVDKKGYADWQAANQDYANQAAYDAYQQGEYTEQFEADVAEYMRSTGADRYTAENWVKNYYANGG